MLSGEQARRLRSALPRPERAPRARTTPGARPPKRRERSREPRQVPTLWISLLLVCVAVLVPLGVLALRDGGAGASLPEVERADADHPEQVRELAASSPKGSHPVPVWPEGLDPYRGLGAWIDHYDYSARQQLDAWATAADLQHRGVRTIYLQTGRWNLPGDITDPEAVSAIVDAAHAHGIRVVGWYLPGFADLARDVRASLAVLSFRTPAGQGFDGFAADIEDFRAVGGRTALFDAGVVAYSAQLRAAAPPGTILGAIVPDAKNNLRAPGVWAGFPWADIAHRYDVVMPMAYWSVTKGACSNGLNADAYMREVMGRTLALMGTPKPMHPIGGIADCSTPTEVEEYVNVGRQEGWLGGSIYDVLTTNRSPWSDRMWEQLRRFNG